MAYIDENQVVDILNSMKFPVLGAGGGFAPIGKEGYQDGQTAPQGWLICDGSTHNIADYPELAAYFASHHGSANYYGGDGITTFAVPTRSGMPTSGENLSSTEKIIGVDENRKPIYSKLVDLGSQVPIPSDSWYSTSVDSSSMDRIIYAGATRPGSSSGLYTSLLASTNDNSTIELKSAISTNIQYLYLRYTKINDTPIDEGHSADGNGVFCIKATVSGDANGHVYSTEEHIVGTWIDRKPIYEKTIFGTLPTQSSNEWYVSLGVSIDNVIEIKAMAYSSGGQYRQIPYIYSPTSQITTPLQIGVNNNTASSNKNSLRMLNETWAGANYYVTIQYTKTS